MRCMGVTWQNSEAVGIKSASNIAKIPTEQQSQDRSKTVSRRHSHESSQQAQITSTYAKHSRIFTAASVITCTRIAWDRILWIFNVLCDMTHTYRQILWAHLITVFLSTTKNRMKKRVYLWFAVAPKLNSIIKCTLWIYARMNEWHSMHGILSHPRLMNNFRSRIFGAERKKKCMSKSAHKFRI